MANYKLISFDKITSTQDYALDLIAAGKACDCTAIVASAQSAGRGRLRRTWVSHHGNLYTSFIYKSEERDSKLAYHIAVAVAETLIAFGIIPQIKWPNDILIDGKKVCGILIEYASNFVVVGIGINIKSNPTLREYKTTKLENYKSVSDTRLLALLMRNIDLWCKRDFLSVRARWMELAIGINGLVRYRGSDAILVGINENGALVLRCDSRYFLAYGDEINCI